MTYLLIGFAWLAIGAAVGIVEARHGAWRLGWTVSSLFGPLAVPLALQRRHRSLPAPAMLSSGQEQRGQVGLLIGFDGSDASLTAATHAAGLFGPRLRRVTLATVLDVDTATPHPDSVLYPEPWPEALDARERLAEAAAALCATLAEQPGSVILAGVPADALERYALAEGYDVLVIGCRGRGRSKRLFGSCASKLSGKAHVPVLLIPAEAAVAAPEGTTRQASQTAGDRPSSVLTAP